ncbi:uncharacterized protein LOC128883668 isoform X2 [Hylaeus volcanicus]|uniref:uncharacterized protein LOC128883668 isoform X2 n=1 Tax=Hylaeus volcanicus TaxID=313075 RepID=UPI0023B84EB1|nr:uncharacterized protein LOC128883668 isoform X2 [Hylaeus volcanicus]
MRKKVTAFYVLFNKKNKKLELQCREWHMNSQDITTHSILSQVEDEIIVSDTDFEKTKNDLNERIIDQNKQTDGSNTNNDHTSSASPAQFNLTNQKFFKNEGSLLRLFQSDFFDIYLHMYYLYNRLEPGIQDYLVNLLYCRTKNEISFYLPQLCTLSVVRRKKSNLSRFLLYKAATSMDFALKISWWFTALSDTANEEIQSIAHQLYQEVEMAIVNSKASIANGSSKQRICDFHVSDVFQRLRVVTYLETNQLYQNGVTQPLENTLPPRANCECISNASLAHTTMNSPANEKTINENCQNFIPPSNLNLNLPTFEPLHNKSQDKMQDSFTNEDNPGEQTLSKPFKNAEKINNFSPNECLLSSPVNSLEINGNLEDIAQEHNRNNKSMATTSTVDNLLFYKLSKETINADFMNSTGMLKLPKSSLSFSSIESKLGCPFKSILSPDVISMDSEMQQYIAKQMRCDYYNLVHSFINTLIEVSILLVREPNRSLRSPFLKLILNAMNDWMFSRRCMVAVSKGSFSMTCLSIPFEKLTPSIFAKGFTFAQSHSLQILRFIPEECRVLSTKRRAPFLLVFEIADLDEDLHLLESQQKTDQAFHECNSIKKETPCIEWNDLYVYNMILEDVKKRNLYTPPSTLQMDENGRESSLHALKRCMGVYENVTTDKTDSTPLQNKSFDTAVKLNDQFDSNNSSHTFTSFNEPDTLSPVSYTRKKIHQNSSSSLSNCEYPNSSESMDDPSVCQSSKRSENNFKEFPLKHSNFFNFSILKELHYDDEQNLRGVNTNPLIIADVATVFKTNSSTSTEPDHPDSSKHGSNRSKQNDKKVMSFNSATASHYAASANSVRKNLWGTLWAKKKKYYKKKSVFGRLKSWDIASVFIKGGDDVRQEALASQLIKQFKFIFVEANIPLYLYPYDVLVTGSNAGIMVFVPDAISLDSLKKRLMVDSIATVFECAFADNIYAAKKNFIESHAAYSLVGYLLQVKDRHNGNYLLDAEGHIIHIDYGYMLSNSPGSVNFESSPFKLTTEFIDIMDGEDSDNFEYFRKLIVQGFLEVRKHADRLFLIVEMMLSMPQMPCFLAGTEATFLALKKRFMLNLTEEVCIQKVHELIDISVNNWRSIHYDTFQRLTNGII